MNGEMTHNPHGVAVFLEEGELHLMFDDWPAQIRLAICLGEEGSCAILVYHEAEEDRIMLRVGDLMGLPPDGFAVVPRRPGFATRRMRFSDEQKLMTLIAEAEGLREVAADYAINYAFAADEGLNPELMTTGVQAEAPVTRTALADAVALPEPMRIARIDARPVPEPRGVVRGSLPRWADLGPHLPEVAQAPSAAQAIEPVAADPAVPPIGFRLLSEIERRATVMGRGRLTLAEDGTLWLASVGGAGGVAGAEAEVGTEAVATVYFRDDLRSFALPVEALGPQLAAGLPGRVALAGHLFPAPLLAELRRAPLAARLILVGDFLQVFPGLPQVAVPFVGTPLADADDMASELRRRTRPMRPWMRGGIGGATLLVLVLIQAALAPVLRSAETKGGRIDRIRDTVFAAAGRDEPRATEAGSTQ